MVAANVQSTRDRPRLEERWLWAVRLLWVLFYGFSLTVFIYAVVVGYTRLMTVCTPPGCADDQLLPAVAQTLTENDISLQIYALYNIGLTVLFAVVYLALAALIFWRRSDDSMAIFASFTLIVFGVYSTELVGGLAERHLLWLRLLAFIEMLIVTGFTCLLYLFPDGRFVPGWTRWLAAAWVVIGLSTLFIGPVVPDAVRRIISFGMWPALVQYLTLAVLFGAGIGAQIYRYRRRSNAVQRQQTKWVVFGLVITTVAWIGLNELLLTFAPAWMTNGTHTRMVIDAFMAGTVVFTAVTFGVAILRYRLWDIDLVIRRTLIYTVLSGLLALTYFGAVLLLETVRPVFSAQPSQLETVLATLLIAALFAPLRRSVQHLIDRRFYRKRYNSDQVLARFSAKIRNEVELETLRTDLVDVVQETMQPAHVALWLATVDGHDLSDLLRGFHA